MENVDYGHHLAFPRLSDSEVEALAGPDRRCSFQDGDRIFAAGQRGLPFYVVESGEIAIVDDSADVPKTIVVHGPREFTGDVSLLTDRPAVISAYARGETRAYCVSQSELRRVIQELPDLSDKLLEAFQTRRIMLEKSGFVGVRVFGHLGDPDLMAIREFFDKNKVPHTWIDADAPDGQAQMKAMEIAPDQLPFVACNRGTRSPRPTVTRIAEYLGLTLTAERRSQSESPRCPRCGSVIIRGFGSDASGVAERYHRAIEPAETLSIRRPIRVRVL